jgi:hypothetical protein
VSNEGSFALLKLIALCSKKRIWEDWYRVQLSCEQRVWSGMESYLERGYKREGSVSTHVFKGSRANERYAQFAKVVRLSGAQFS